MKGTIREAIESVAIILGAVSLSIVMPWDLPQEEIKEPVVVEEVFAEEEEVCQNDTYEETHEEYYEEYYEEPYEDVSEEPYEEVYEETYEEPYEEVYEEVYEEPYEEPDEETYEESYETGLTYLGTFEITAYEWTGNPCANGNYPTEGYTVACNSLPIGTQVYIEGVGYRTVEDRGASWHSSNWLDLYLGSVGACTSWGRQYLNVYKVEG